MDSRGVTLILGSDETALTLLFNEKYKEFVNRTGGYTRIYKLGAQRTSDAAELALIEASDSRAFPPRLPEQPIFYPVTNEAYAAQIARDIEAGLDHGREHGRIGGGRTQRGDDLGAASGVHGYLACGALLQHRHRRQRLALHKFQEGPTAGRDVGYTILDAVLLDRRQRIAAAGVKSTPSPP